MPIYGGAYTVNGATFTGGRGGLSTGSSGANIVSGGQGGSGLITQSNATVTVTSGTFQGGAGGNATAAS